MKDREFLMWLAARLQHVHCTSPYLDYMHRLRCIIDTIPEDQVTKIDTNISHDVLYRIDMQESRIADRKEN